MLFQCSSASRKFSIERGAYGQVQRFGFSALQRAENSQFKPRPRFVQCEHVSVLFSEPKILNAALFELALDPVRFQCSSASRKFSIRELHERRRERPQVSVLFSEPKILNMPICAVSACCTIRFSALQRAENSQFHHTNTASAPPSEFQCSSASRKFSIDAEVEQGDFCEAFQCSSASRKFSIRSATARWKSPMRVSVLFSEPKILNKVRGAQRPAEERGFSALQRAENSQSTAMSAGA